MKSKCITRYLRMAAVCFLLTQNPWILFAQVPQPVNPGQPVPVPSLPANELDSLVAPIALYPDPLISQILVAATYPLEVVEAYQWLQRNPGLTGPALEQAAQAQNWDPSVQALIMFPEVLKHLNEDVAWTTNLGNAFLAQQAAVIDSIQRMRFSAQQSGRLVSTPQQQVITTVNASQPVVVITPTTPDVIYVPVYDPLWIWGPPVYYAYPRWYYPPQYSGLFFNAGISVGRFLGGGWGGWSGWGWHPGWGNHAVVVNNTSIQRFNFNTVHVTNLRGTSVWYHDGFHRQGVAYPNRPSSAQWSNNVRPDSRSRQLTPMQPQLRPFAASRPSLPQNVPSAAPTQ